MNKSRLVLIVLVLLLLVTACEPANNNGDHPAGEANNGLLTLPDLSAVELGEDRLQVVATTSIIGDVVGQVGGDLIELTTLIGPGRDPHSYKPAARDLATVANAHVVFINGWDLEEGLAADLANIGREVPIVPISANIRPLFRGVEESGHEEDLRGTDAGDHAHEEGLPDPHVWFSIPHVIQWVDNVAQVLGDLDPTHAADYAANAATYQRELEALAANMATQLAQIPQDRRLLVTNHDSLIYFARDYGFDILGTVFPGNSTAAEPAAGDLAGLISLMAEHGICTLFTESTMSNDLAQTIATELDDCTTVQVLSLYTGALGPAGSGADSYVGMFHANVEAIVRGLQQE